MSLEEKVLDVLLKQQQRLVVIASGAAAGVQNLIWQRPGISKFFTGAYFPYDRAETRRLLGFEPQKSVSRKTALQFAQEAFKLACGGTGNGTPMGLGITAAVTTDRVRQGDNVVEVALMTPTTTLYLRVPLAKAPQESAMLTRVLDGMTADQQAFVILADFLGLTTPIAERVSEAEQRDVLYEHPLFMPNGQRPEDWRAILCGSHSRYLGMVPFSGNPMHYGHEGMAEALEYLTGGRSFFTITADPLHKPVLTTAELLRRAAQFRDKLYPLLLTGGDPLFIHQARNIPGKLIGVGVDTLKRILEPKWFTLPDGGVVPGIPADWATSNLMGIHYMLGEFRNLGTKFVVFDRNSETLNDVALPGDFRDLFIRAQANWPISSTAMRNAS